MKANEIQLRTTDGRTTFAAEPDETDVLEAAREGYAKLTPKQRELTYPFLVQRKDLWPYRVVLTQTFDLGGGKALRQGDQLRLMDVQPGKLFVLAEEIKTTFQVVPQATDFMAQARKFVEDEQAGPRLVVMQKLGEEKQRVQGRLVVELEGKLISSVTGQPQPLDPNSLPRYIVFYRGSSTCPITRKFTPTLVKFYQETKPAHPEFEVIYLMTDPVAETGKFAKAQGFSWRAVEYKSTSTMPITHASISGLLPQLIVMDRTGKVLANGTQNAAPVALQQLQALLQKTPEQK